MSVTVPSGIYYISSQLTQTVLTLTGADERNELTSWSRYDGQEQQWNVTSVNDLYTIRSVAFGHYISFDGRTLQFNPYTAFWARPDPFRFYFQPYKGGYLIGCQSIENVVMNLAGATFANNTLVILWPLSIHPGPDNAVWYFNSTTASTVSPPSSSSNTTVTGGTTRSLAGPIAGGVVGGLIAIIGLLILAFYFGRRNRPSTPPPVQQYGVTYQTTPLVLGTAPSSGIMPPRPPEMQGPIMPSMPAMSTPHRQGLGSVHKPSLNSQSDPYQARPDTGVSGHDRMMSVGSWAASSSSNPTQPVASTAGSRATDSVMLPADPPPMYR